MLSRASLVSRVCFTFCAALAFQLLLQLPAPLCQLSAGAQLLAVWLVPYRYWWALALGSMLAALPVVSEGIGNSGWRWACLRLLPSIWPLMLLVYRGRVARWWPSSIRSTAWLLMVWPLLLLMMAAAALVSGWSVLVALAAVPGSPPADSLTVDLPSLLLGNYLGILGVLPLGLSVAGGLEHSGDWGDVWRGLVRRVGLSEWALTLSGTVALASVLQWLAGIEPSVIWRSSALLAAGVAALRYGWAATVLLAGGGALVASYGSFLALTSSQMQFDFFMAVALSFCLLVAAKISRSRRDQRLEQERYDRLLASGSALFFNIHLRFQQVCGWLKQDTQALCEAQQQLDEHRRPLPAAQEPLDLKERTLRARHKLIELVDELSLPGQIDSEAALAGIFHGLGIVFVSRNCQALVRRPYPLRVIWYRLLLEAGAYLASWPEGCSQLKLRVRDGGPGRGLLVQLSAHWSSDGAADHQPQQYRQRLQRLLRFSCTGMQLEGLEYLVQLHRGQLRCHYLSSKVCLSLILPDEMF